MIPGVTWELLYALDAEYYWQSSRHDYIILPPEARTVSTRVRWWQMVSPGVTRVPWSLRNIFIGGSAINPSALYENFNIPLNEALVAPGTGPGQPWGFQELGQHELTFGERMDPVMSWPESNYSKYIETNQMIIQTDYMIQFKVDEMHTISNYWLSLNSLSTRKCLDCAYAGLWKCWVQEQSTPWNVKISTIRNKILSHQICKHICIGRFKNYEKSLH